MSKRQKLIAGGFVIVVVFLGFFLANSHGSASGKQTAAVVQPVVSKVSTERAENSYSLVGSDYIAIPAVGSETPFTVSVEYNYGFTIVETVFMNTYYGYYVMDGKTSYFNGCSSDVNPISSAAQWFASGVSGVTITTDSGVSVFTVSEYTISLSSPYVLAWWEVSGVGMITVEYPVYYVSSPLFMVVFTTSSKTQRGKK